MLSLCVEGTEACIIVSKMMRSHQLVPDIGAHLKDRIEKAGFVNQKLHIFEFKMNHTDKGGQLVW